MAQKNPIPEEMELSRSVLKWTGVTLVGFVFVVASILLTLNGDGGIKMWLSGLFFALVMLVGLVQLLGGSKLRLNPDGFQYTSMFKTHSYQWKDISRFGYMYINGNQHVTFQLRNDQPRNALSKLNRALGGMSGSLPDSYGYKAHELVAIMEQFRRRSVARLAKRETELG